MVKDGIKRFEQYQDMIGRLYPEFGHKDTPVVQGSNPQLTGKDNTLTRNITFMVTDACSLRCTYCYEINKTTRMMSKEVAKKFIDLILSGEKGMSDYVSPEFSPAVVLEFIGGEPFLNTEVIDYACTYFMTRCIELNHPWADKWQISICSNGVHYFEPQVQEFLKKWGHKLSFSVTIDGNKELHDSCRVFPDGKTGSYDYAIAAAKDWISRGNYMGSKITIAPGNIIYVADAIKHMISLGYTEINCNCVYEKGWTDEHATELYKQLKIVSDYVFDNNLEDKLSISILDNTIGIAKREDDLHTWCGGSSDAMLACDPDGVFFPCLRYSRCSLGDSQPEVVFGNVDDGICQKEEEKQLRCELCKTNRRTYNTDECFYCPIYQGCAECAAYNYQVSGDFHHRATFICCMHKARVLVNYYHWSRYYQKHNMNKIINMYIPDDWAIKIIGEDEWNMIKSLPNVKHTPFTWQEVRDKLKENPNFFSGEKTNE